MSVLNIIKTGFFAALSCLIKPSRNEHQSTKTYFMHICTDSQLVRYECC